MRDFIRIADSLEFEIGNSYIIHVADSDVGINESIGFAKRVNCEHGTGCNVCKQCSKIERNEHSDITIIPNEDDESSELSTIKIETIRGIRGDAFKKPFEGKYRVFIIKYADRMTDQAQNALLKILEEPPPESIFLLVTVDVFGLLATIRSRCRQFNYPYAKKIDINYRGMVDELIAVQNGELDVFFNYTKKISQTKFDLLNFLDFSMILLRDVLCVRHGCKIISDGIDDTLKSINNDNIEGAISQLSYYYSIVKNRSISKELVAINSLNLLMGRE